MIIRERIFKKQMSPYMYEYVCSQQPFLHSHIRIWECGCGEHDDVKDNQKKKIFNRQENVTIQPNRLATLSYILKSESSLWGFRSECRKGCWGLALQLQVEVKYKYKYKYKYRPTTLSTFSNQNPPFEDCDENVERVVEGRQWQLVRCNTNTK